MSAKAVLSAIPVSVYLGAAALLTLYVIGRKAGGQGIGDSIGTGLGKVIGNVATGAVKGTATGTGRAVGAVLQSPANIVDGIGQQLSGSDDWSLGSWLYDIAHEAYDPNKGLQSDGDVLRQGAANTDAAWGKIGRVQLVN